MQTAVVRPYRRSSIAVHRGPRRRPRGETQVLRPRNLLPPRFKSRQRGCSRRRRVAQDAEDRRRDGRRDARCRWLPVARRWTRAASAAASRGCRRHACGRRRFHAAFPLAIGERRAVADAAAFERTLPDSASGLRERATRARSAQAVSLAPRCRRRSAKACGCLDPSCAKS